MVKSPLAWTIGTANAAVWSLSRSRCSNDSAILDNVSNSGCGRARRAPDHVRKYRSAEIRHSANRLVHGCTRGSLTGPSTTKRLFDARIEESIEPIWL